MPKIILAAHGRITSRHGQNIGRGFPHRGVDQGHNNGTAYDLEVRAPADGIVTFAGEFGSYGLCMFITHRDGWVTVLAHHAKQLVRKGSWVKQGQLIAVMGNSGTKYVHSHQELRDNTSRQLDPLEHLVTATTASSTPEPVQLPAPPKLRNPVALGFSTTNHGADSFAVLTDGVWTAVPTKALADAISTHPNVGKFTVLTVKDFYEMRDASLKPATVAPVTVNNAATDPAKIAAAVVAAFKAAL